MSGPADCLPIAAIQRIVAAQFGMPVKDLQSERRDAATVRARHAAIYLCREHTPFSLPVIGRHFGQRDHTTVMYAIRRTRERIARMPAVAEAIATLSAEVEAASARKRSDMGACTATEVERENVLEKLAPLLRRRTALLVELEQVNDELDRLGHRCWGTTEADHETRHTTERRPE